MTLDTELAKELLSRKESFNYRKRQIIESPQGVSVVRGGKKLLSFCSNDYLGLANHEKVKEAFISATHRYGVGSGASHLVCGHSEEHHRLEEELAEFVERPRAILFSTGYMANLGVINALVDKGDAVFEDKLNHASLIDGGLLSRSEFVRFRHNDMEHLESRLSRTQAKRKLVVTDGVFSMDGNLANLPKLSATAHKYGAHVMVDDAHGFGCIGDKGKGTVNYHGVNAYQVPILVGTLGKAFGTFGAFVAGSKALIESLIQFSRSYIYTTAIPPALAAATRTSLRILESESYRRENLNARIAQFRNGCADLGLNLLPSLTPIQPLLIGDNKLASDISAILEKKGIWATAIRPPTVPNGTARIRFTFTADHTESHIDQLLDCLDKQVTNLVV